VKTSDSAPSSSANDEVIEAASMIAIRLLATDHRRSRRDRLVYADREVHVLSKQHIDELKKSALVWQLRGLSEIVRTQTQGEHAQAQALAIAVNFYNASGMPFRQLESLALYSAPDRTLGIPKDKNSEALRHLCLWTPAIVTNTSPRFGPHSMLGANRENLRTVASSWLDLNVRVPWFEKMLVEALLAAEAFATVQEFRKNPIFTLGKQGLVRSIVWETIYDRTGGQHPYELLHILARTILFVLGATLLIAAAAYSTHLVDSDHVVSGYAGLAVTAWIGVNWAGRFITQRIAKWAKPLRLSGSGDVTHLSVEVVSLSARATEPDVSLHDLRDALCRAAALGCVHDQVARSLIERAIQAGEVRWKQYSYVPIARFEDDVEQVLRYYSSEQHDAGR
jgi:hypothetical protein